MVVAPRVSQNKPKNGKHSKRPRPPPATAAPADDELQVDGLADDKSTKIRLVAQEIKFAKLFAGNNTRISEKQLVKLKKWFEIRSQSSFPFDNQNFMRIWKGLFYSMWMSDKPLPQEQLAENIASLVHSFGRPEISIQFFSAFLKTMCAEWFGIDQWRIDKFMMLVRRTVRQLFVLLHANDWEESLIEQLNEAISQAVLKTSASVGFYMHFTELYMEEVAKVSGGAIPESSVTALVKPFAAYIARPRDHKLARHAIKHVFDNLLFQSDMGREYQEKFEAWKEMGFPGNSIDELEQYEDEEEEMDGEEAENEEDGEDEEEGDDDEDDDDEEEEEDDSEESGVKHLDPRAGRVDVVMPVIPFDAQEIISVLEEEKYKTYTNNKTRQLISRVVNNYSTYASGKFPLGVQTIKLKSDIVHLPNIEDKVNEIVDFERKLLSQNEPLKKLSKKHRKKVLAGLEVPSKKSPVKRAHHDCSDHDHCSARKRRSITPQEKQQINQWQEEDIVVPQAATPEPAAVTTPKEKKRKSKSSVDTPKPAAAATVAATSPVSVTPQKVKTPPKQPAAGFVVDPWDQPLEDGEIEYTTKSSKKRLKEINEQAALAFAAKSGEKKVLNPVAVAALRGKQSKTPSTPATPANHTSHNGTPATPASNGEKRVKIMLKMNRSQETSEYFQQLRNSPNTPYDANAKPSKGLLKPNLMPSPINPYYRKKLGLSFE